MTYIEYALYDLDMPEAEIKTNIESAIRYGVDCVSVPFALTKFCKNLSKGTKTLVSNAIDYPLGISDTNTRNSAVSNAIQNGATKIDLVIQNNYLGYKKYEKLKQDILSNLEICQNNNVSLFFYLEYRIFTHQALIKACNLLLETNSIKNVYVSTGYMLDSIDDNIIATVLLKQKTNINTIFTGNIWTKNHIKTLVKNNITSIRTNTVNAISLFTESLSKNID